MRRVALAVLPVLSALLVAAEARAAESAVEVRASFPGQKAGQGEKGPVVKVEAYPILERVVDEATEKVTARLGKRQTYAYLKPGQEVLRMPLEPGPWRLVVGPDDTTDRRDVDVTLAAGATEKVDLAFGKILVAPRTVEDGAMPSKVEVWRGKERVFYGYTKAEQKNVVVCVFPGALRVRIHGDDEPENAIETAVTLAAGASERVEGRFGRVEFEMRSIAKSKIELFVPKAGGGRRRVLYTYTKPDARRAVRHLVPGSYVLAVTDEESERTTESALEVPADRAVQVTR